MRQRKKHRKEGMVRSSRTDHDDSRMMVGKTTTRMMTKRKKTETLRMMTRERMDEAPCREVEERKTGMDKECRSLGQGETATREG